MKKVLLVLLIAAFAMPAFVSCKKGANDPAISLNSRAKRLEADWKLTNFDGTYNYVGGTTAYTVTLRFDGNTYSQNESPAGGIYGNLSGSGSFKMTIAKDGAYSIDESYTASGATSADIRKGDGYWYWGDNDNAKIAVNFSIGGSNLFFSGRYEIDKLSSKELILTKIQNYVVDGDATTYNYVYTFTAQ
jgi:hypothetical protein